MAFEFELPPAPTQNIKVESGRRRSRPPLGLDGAATAKAADRSRQADRRVEMHRLQGLSGRMPGMERQDRADRFQLRRLRQSGRSDGGIVHGDAVHRMGQSGDPESGMAHPQRRLHALRRSGLPEGMPGAGRDRAVFERHRRLRPRQVHRLRLLHQGMSVRHSAHLRRSTTKPTSARSAPTASPSARVRPAPGPARRTRSCSAPRKR